MERPSVTGLGLRLFQSLPACPREPVASSWLLVMFTDVRVSTTQACRSQQAAVWGGGHRVGWGHHVSWGPLGGVGPAVWGGGRCGMGAAMWGGVTV